MKRPIQERDCTNGNASDFGYVKWAEAVLRKQSGQVIENAEVAPLHLAQRDTMFTLLTIDETRAKESEPMSVAIPFNSRYKLMVSVNMVMDPVQRRMRPAVIMKGAAEQVILRSDSSSALSQPLSCFPDFPALQSVRARRRVPPPDEREGR
jgi:magnesium-transporting ATPase (P-type)